jgi:diguanylate cyclase (GGDEF)-like protein
VRSRLLGIVFVAAVAFGAVATVAAVSSSRVGRLAQQEHRVVALQQQYLGNDVLMEETRGSVYEIVTTPASGAARQDQFTRYAELRQEFDDLAGEALRDVPNGPLSGSARTIAALTRDVLIAADAAVEAAKTEPTVAVAKLRVLDARTTALNGPLDAQIATLTTLQANAIVDTRTARQTAANAVEITSALGVLALFTLALLAAGSIVRGLRSVTRSAGQLAEGDFDARYDDDRGDEIGMLGQAFNATAASLQEMMRRLEDTAVSLREVMGRQEQQSRRDDFGRQLNEAFEIADTEDQTYDVVTRSFPMISAVNPMELLVADSSKAHLEGCAEHPDAGAPGCAVASPFGCVAVRRGTTTVFPDSRALNACPKLRERGGDGPLSAVCVPVTFMGRALGVLHAAAPVDAPLAPEEIARLATVAVATGARIGTVRSFERTQLQASTDGLTGLMNRRTFETTARPMVRDGGPFVVVMADVDHFKRVNDTLGHAAGDKALALFAQLLRVHLRSEDLLARYGGEEFVLLLQGTSAHEAVEVLDRFRARLAEATGTQPPVFTASFGVADAGSADSLAGLIRRADAALYRAKEEGRDRVVVDDGAPELPQQAISSALERSLIEDDPLADMVRQH